MWLCLNALAGGILIGLGTRLFGPALGRWWRCYAAAALSTLAALGAMLLATTRLPPDATLFVLAWASLPIELLAGPIDTFGPDLLGRAGVVLSLPASWLIIRLLVRDERGVALGWGASLVVALFYSLAAALSAALLL